jgi:hypothetical protein
MRTLEDMNPLEVFPLSVTWIKGLGLPKSHGILLPATNSLGSRYELIPQGIFLPVVNALRLYLSLLLLLLHHPKAPVAKLCVLKSCRNPHSMTSQSCVFLFICFLISVICRVPWCFNHGNRCLIIDDISILRFPIHMFSYSYDATLYWLYSESSDFNVAV